MKRLTIRLDNGRAFPNSKPKRYISNEEIYEKLADYEDAEENGLLLKLQIKVRDKVYAIEKLRFNCKELTKGDGCDEYDVDDYLVTWCEKNCKNGFSGVGVIDCFVTSIYIDENEKFFTLNKCGRKKFSEFGKTVFLTEEDAEKALEGMKNADN